MVRLALLLLLAALPMHALATCTAKITVTDTWVVVVGTSWGAVVNVELKSSTAVSVPYTVTLKRASYTAVTNQWNWGGAYVSPDIVNGTVTESWQALQAGSASTASFGVVVEGTTFNMAPTTVKIGAVNCTVTDDGNTCAAGQYLPDNSQSCAACPVGSYSGAGAYSCTTCPLGYFSNSTSTASCTQCSAGTFAKAGASSCSSCTRGSYSTAGAGSCSICPAGTYSVATTSTTCTQCQAGTFAQAGSSLCSACAGRFYSSTAGAAKCNFCDSSLCVSNGNTFCGGCDVPAPDFSSPPPAGAPSPAPVPASPTEEASPPPPVEASPPPPVEAPPAPPVPCRRKVGTYQLLMTYRDACTENNAAEYLVYRGGSSKGCSQNTTQLRVPDRFVYERSLWSLITAVNGTTSFVTAGRNCPSSTNSVKSLAGSTKYGTARLGGSSHKWRVVPVGQDCSLVNIIYYSTSSAPKYLSSSAACSTYEPYLAASDDGSGLQRWRLVPAA